jgi:hypothetical protein
MNLREVTMKYGSLDVIKCHDSAEIWGLRCGLALGIGTKKIMASTSVFVRVVFSLKHSTSSFSTTSRIFYLNEALTKPRLPEKLSK